MHTGVQSRILLSSHFIEWPFGDFVLTSGVGPPPELLFSGTYMPVSFLLCVTEFPIEFSFFPIVELDVRQFTTKIIFKNSEDFPGHCAVCSCTRPGSGQPLRVLSGGLLSRLCHSSRPTRCCGGSEG